MLPNFDWDEIARELNVPVHHLAAYLAPYETVDDYELDILVNPQGSSADE